MISEQQKGKTGPERKENASDTNTALSRVLNNRYIQPKSQSTGFSNKLGETWKSTKTNLEKDDSSVISKTDVETVKDTDVETNSSTNGQTAAITVTITKDRPDYRSRISDWYFSDAYAKKRDETRGSISLETDITITTPETITKNRPDYRSRTSDRYFSDFSDSYSKRRDEARKSVNLETEYAESENLNSASKVTPTLLA